MSKLHIANEEYIEAIECIKEESGPSIEKWTEDTLNMMALSQAKLHFYSSAYTYYMLADNKTEAAKIFQKIPMTELEEKYKDHINTDVKIMRVKGRRGVFVTKDLNMNEEICRIPLYLCTEGTKKEMVEYLSQSNIYSRSMPKSETFPVTWEPYTCDQIGVSIMRIILEQQIQDWKKEEKNGYVDNYLYLRSLAGSRCFAEGDKEYMVPFADMLNHSNDPNVDWKFQNNHFVMTTICPVKAHEELFDHYGPKSNYESFLHYGFVQPNNTKLDVVRLVGELPENVAKTRLDPRYFHQSFEFELRGSYMEGTVEIFSFLRYVRSNDKKCPESLQGYLKRPVSKENELWVCKMLYNILQKEVHRRVKETTGVEEALAVALLQSEMAVLVHWGETLTDAIKILEGDKKLLKKSTNDYIIKVVKANGYYK